ncbi:DOPA 4,5-dioxygenase family protein [Rheinheimera salexigens]|uniref:4,5-dioxygenase n=1 Tax=Rheinheimera salexigens TaxID=1628148 RepID=A0A1E7Q8F5_9GAMM|nr:DOPA 4,5-dioxygenase family protein [Rheinheimera salexigens]OEY70475.1 4,5-dioxygenase [Rheinheimera salexigens]
MREIKRPVNSHRAYHAHVYFEQETLEFAAKLCKEAGERFNLKVGRIHQAMVGPHPKWSCQITFGAKHFDQLVLWLEQNRKGLTVLIHALSGNDLNDHTIYAYWLGDSVELDISMFSA